LSYSNHYLFKPIFDFILSIILLIIVLPIIIICWLLLYIPNKRKVFFVQTRTGKNGKEFNLIKFRTLFEDNITANKHKFREFLRESHLDELPQIFNVLKGEMSLVGPRPLLPEYQQYYDAMSGKYRNIIKPGITGLTQISGGKYLPWARRFSLDLFYIHHVTFIFDLLIICRTFHVFLRTPKTPYSNQINNDISYIDYIKGQNKNQKFIKKNS
jgi:undecaprenyl phosphate N,N'-diacetylbacillosamine 1-phosphate transferase